MIPKPPSRASEKRRKRLDAEDERRRVYKQVDLRDGYSCRACGCRLRMNGGLEDRAEHHHIRPRSAGGRDTSANLILLCPADHADRHAYRLTITGNGDSKVNFERDGRRWTA